MRFNLKFCTILFIVILHVNLHVCGNEEYVRVYEDWELELEKGESCETEDRSSGICLLPKDCLRLPRSKYPYNLCSEDFSLICCPLVTPTPPPHSINRLSGQKCEEYSNLNYTTYTQPDLSIVGGTIVSNGTKGVRKYPHACAIGWEVSKKTFRCGGTLISAKFVLTAAHCDVSYRSEKPSFVRFADDLYNVDQYTFDYEIEKIIKHPRYNPPFVYNDIALIKLKQNVKFYTIIRPACLYEPEISGDINMFAIGYGRTSTYNGMSNNLREVTLPTISNDQCNDSYSKMRSYRVGKGIMKSQLCTFEIGKDACGGDSGGPLLIKKGIMDYVGGVTSFGVNCAEKHPGVFTRVSSYLKFIEDNVWKN